MLDLFILSLLILAKGTMVLAGVLVLPSASFDEYYIAPPIKNQLRKSLLKIHEADQDRVFLVTGREGSGKSLFAMQLAYFIDKTFSLEDVCFSADEFEKRMRTTTKRVIIFDEAFNGLSSKGVLSKQNKRLVKLLVEARQLNLVVFIVLPSIFLLEKYVAIFRSHGCFNVAISKRNHKIRFYKVYNYANKKLLFTLGQKYMSYSKPYIAIKHRFYGSYPPTINKKEYDAKKLESFRKPDKVEEESKFRRQRNYLFYYLNRIQGMKQTEIAEVMKKGGFPMTSANIQQLSAHMSKELKEKGATTIL